MAIFILPPCFSSSRAKLEFMRFRAHQSPSKQSSTYGSRYSSTGIWRSSIAPTASREDFGMRLTPGANQRQPEMIFQESVHAVHVAPQLPAGDDQMFAHGANHVAFRPERLEIDGRAKRLADGRCRRG